MDTFYSQEELSQLGIKKYGKNVLIGRHAILYHPERLTIGHDVRIDDFTILSGNITLHNYIHISHFCGLYGGQAGIEMFDFSGLSSKVTIYGESDDYSGNSLTNPMIPCQYKPYEVSAKVKIEKHSIIGAGSIILPGTVIAEGSSIGSMSLCVKSTLPWTINVGIPAKLLKKRERSILKLEEDFLKDLLEQ